MAERLRRAIACLVLALASAGAASAGDLGRPDPGEGRNPQSGRPLFSFGQTAISFNKTDAEIDMGNRLWRFVSPQQLWDWMPDRAAMLRPASLGFGRHDGPPAVERYYGWLHQTFYQSSSVRYATVSDDIDADLATIPGAFAAICAVREVDRQRHVALANMPDLKAQMAPGVSARKADNDGQIGSFAAALRYRYESYSYALDHLLVETPDPAARDVDARLAQLDIWADEAAHHRFCLSDEEPRVGNPHPGPTLPSRFVHDGAGPVAGS